VDSPWVYEEDKSDGQQSQPESKGPFHDVAMSSEFSILCQAQFEVLKSLLEADRCAIYFRHENPKTGSLEFTPVAVYPEKRRQWVIADNGQVEADGPRELPGFTEASRLIPRYPFMSTSKDGKTAYSDILPDGGLSAPLQYNGMFLGLLVVWKDIHGQDETELCWNERDKVQLENVASTLAIAAVLDQKERWAHTVALESLRTALAETLHQVKNPLTALRTFGKLLLRRLPSEDQLNRELVKDILIQSDRMVDLLLPVDSMITSYLPQGSSTLQSQTTAVAALRGKTIEFEEDLAISESNESSKSHVPYNEMGAATRLLGQAIPLNLCWVDEIAAPILSAATAVAERDKVHFTVLIDDDLPGVFVNDRCLQEALSNILDNALKYVHLGGSSLDTEVEKGPWKPAVFVRIRNSDQSEFDGRSGVVIEVIDNGPGIPQQELDFVYKKNYRGKSVQNLEGSGLGLGIAKDLIISIGGNIILESQEGVGTRVSLLCPRKL